MINDIYDNGAQRHRSNDQKYLAPKILGLRFGMVNAMLIRIRNKYEITFK